MKVHQLLESTPQDFLSGIMNSAKQLKQNTSMLFRLAKMMLDSGEPNPDKFTAEWQHTGYGFVDSWERLFKNHDSFGRRYSKLLEYKEATSILVKAQAALTEFERLQKEAANEVENWEAAHERERKSEAKVVDAYKQALKKIPRGSGFGSDHDDWITKVNELQKKILKDNPNFNFSKLMDLQGPYNEERMAFLKKTFHPLFSSEPVKKLWSLLEQYVEVVQHLYHFEASVDFDPETGRPTEGLEDLDDLPNKPMTVHLEISSGGGPSFSDEDMEAIDEKLTYITTALSSLNWQLKTQHGEKVYVANLGGKKDAKKLVSDYSKLIRLFLQDKNKLDKKITGKAAMYQISRIYQDLWPVLVFAADK